MVLERQKMNYGYARVSTKLQAKDGNSLEVQEKALREAGAEIIYKDAYTGLKKERPGLERLLEVIRPGDKLIITKLDRIARSLSQGTQIIQELIEKGVIIHVLNLGIMDETPTGKLIRSVMLAFAEFEHGIITERMREGKEIAMQDPEYQNGRPPKYDQEQLDHALELLQTKSYTSVTKLTGISKSTLIREKKRRNLI